MFNNVVLDVFIGLIFVFLLYSLLATVLQEIIASRFALRGRMLQKALRRMLEDDEYSVKKSPSQFGIINYWVDGLDNLVRFFKPFQSKDSLLSKFYAHPTIKYLGEGKLFKKPAYLNAYTFSRTLIHLLRGNEYDGRTESESVLIKKALDTNSLRINAETFKHLRVLFADARQDSFVFNQKLAEWYDETMQRTTGWYKKQTQVILLWIGFLLAIAFNVDTIAITRTLINNKDAREQTLQLALNAAKEYKPFVDSVKSFAVSTKTFKVRDSLPNTLKDTTINDTITINTARDKFLDSAYHELQKDALQLQGILGLRKTEKDSSVCVRALKSLDSSIRANPSNEELRTRRDVMYKACMDKLSTRSPYQKNWWLMLAGWILTALAISLGAPFWFDLLNKVIKLRAAGTKPTEVSAINNAGASDNRSGKTIDGKNIRG